MVYNNSIYEKLESTWLKLEIIDGWMKASTWI